MHWPCTPSARGTQLLRLVLHLGEVKDKTMQNSPVLYLPVVLQTELDEPGDVFPMSVPS